MTPTMTNFDQLHPWKLEPKEAVRLQNLLRDKVVPRGELRGLRWVAGVDVAYRRGENMARAAAVVCSWPEMEMVEERVINRRIDFPYVPGLLSFREAPPALEALSGLEHPFDCLLVDGQGLAHPRRFGLACHLGLWLDRPSIGCAKSRLYGALESPPGPMKGSFEALKDEEGSTVGLALTTRDRCAPLYVSIGHKVSLERAAEIVLGCCRGTKHPEPLRLADRLSKFSTGSPRRPARQKRRK